MKIIIVIIIIIIIMITIIIIIIITIIKISESKLILAFLLHGLLFTIYDAGARP